MKECRHYRAHLFYIITKMSPQKQPTLLLLLLCSIQLWFSFTCSLFFKVRSPFHSFSLCFIEPLPMYTIHNHFCFVSFIYYSQDLWSLLQHLVEKLSSSTVILRTKFSSTALVCVVFFYLFYPLQYFCRMVNITVILVSTSNLINYFDGLVANIIFVP